MTFDLSNHLLCQNIPVLTLDLPNYIIIGHSKLKLYGKIALSGEVH